MDFSVTEMDVAEQLIQLMSADSIAIGHHQDHTNNNSVEEEEQQCNQVYAADHLSIINVIFPNNHMEEEEEEYQVFSSRKKRFRSIYDLYHSTKPIYVLVK